MDILRLIWAFLRSLFRSRAALAAENVMLRQQLIVVHRSVPRPKLRPADRVLLCWISRLWSGWRSAPLIIKPDTVTRWHRQGFKLYWHWRSHKKPGRPKVDRAIRDLIRRMCRENPTWGAPRILSELLLLGHNVAEATSVGEVKGTPRRAWNSAVIEHSLAHPPLQITRSKPTAHPIKGRLACVSWPAGVFGMDTGSVCPDAWKSASQRPVSRLTPAPRPGRINYQWLVSNPS